MPAARESRRSIRRCRRPHSLCVFHQHRVGAGHRHYQFGLDHDRYHHSREGSRGGHPGRIQSGQFRYGRCQCPRQRRGGRFATILAAAGTDGIRAVNYGTPDAHGLGGTITVTVEAGALVSAGRHGVAAFGFEAATSVSPTTARSSGTTDAIDATTTATGVVVLDNTGYLGGNVISVPGPATRPSPMNCRRSGH